MKKINGVYVRVDLTGQQFGKLTAVQPATRGLYERPKWECSCSCGKVTYVAADKLLSGWTRSCGCNKELSDLSEQVFGRLQPLRPLNKRIDNRIVWLCQCNCGEFCEVTSSQLANGKTRSCGCLSKELSSVRNSTHGMSSSKEYSSWRSMRKRCNNPKNPGFASYGGRGITVCSEWQSSFENFLRDMGPAPGPEYSIDRKDNGQGYHPSNCRWANRQTQQANRSVQKNSKTGVLGVYAKGGRWVASLKREGKLLLYKSFGDFDAAVQARKKAQEEADAVIHNAAVSLETVERQEH